MREKEIKKLVLNQMTTDLVNLALAEDLGGIAGFDGDITTAATIDSACNGVAELVAKEDLVVCGHEVAKSIFLKLDKDASYKVIYEDGSKVSAKTVVATISGRLQALLIGERTTLNFLQRLSGIATLTAKLVQIAGPSVEILDTRKTTPGMRQLEKYAVRVGGGSNHRMGLYDQILIKNNHIDGVGGDVAKTIILCRNKSKPGTIVEVEVRNMEELRMALTASPDIILLDNHSTEEAKAAVSYIRSKHPGIKIEVSGGINLENLADYVATGIDRISLGALTHSVRSVDLSMRISS